MLSTPHSAINSERQSVSPRLASLTASRRTISAMAEKTLYEVHADGNRARGKIPPMDLRGHRYGALTVIDFHSVLGGKNQWSCACDCGGARVMSSSSLRHDLGRKNCGNQLNHNPKYNAERIAARFMRRVNKLGPGGCWVWTGRLGTHGYGEFDLTSERPSRAHRVAYEIFVGPIPEGKMLLHSCDNRKCCNPAHLRPGDAQENSSDMMERETRKYKLTKAIVAQIKRELAANSWIGSGILIASRYNVTPALISAIRRGHIWKNVPWPEGYDP